MSRATVKRIGFGSNSGELPALKLPRRAGMGRLAMQTAKSRYGVGASVPRREDLRHLRGRGEFVSDIRLPGTQEVVFLRSQHAHARIRSISIPPEARGRVFAAGDRREVKPIRVVTQTSGAKSPAWPPLATDKVRYVGE